MKRTGKQVKGFTLVELLVVIAIIAALAVLAAPQIVKALVKAKVVTATNVCTSLEMAVDRFENEYSYLPYAGADAPNGDMEIEGGDNDKVTNDEFMAVLAGLDEDLNPKQMEFFNLGEPKGSNEDNYRDGMNIDKTNGVAQLFDAWGERYYFSLDYDLDGEIEHPFKTGDEYVRGKKVLIFSTGPDGPEQGVPAKGASPKVLKLIPSNFLK
ncbi:prepilin-type N-terminal cleavage/methylation domain-containing protein [Verrucomicrobiaceae bacterium N1E253]|uniref:Prepilin-type N-terminal cleavage/methylation domain-containing protein n=1 Tax=Oceaniferula marina TaxID=2748318 RepID=A0A851GII8_9BACT|nr:prepilin-type N-terminal cleavage/methylation domain-containing protein [Oceaniferula marina]NWK57323.1 prepilin-type N-terminal cleavage/methylation domain-containing protein [Oceaniferula marina]